MEPPSKQVKYKGYHTPCHELLIASALQRELLYESDVPENVWPYLQNAVAFARDHMGDDDVDDD